MLSLPGNSVFGRVALALASLAVSVCLADDRAQQAEKAFVDGERLMRQNTAESLPRALAQFDIALRLWRELNDREQQGVTLSRIGLTYFFQGRHQEALKVYQEALALLEGAKDESWIGITLGNIAQVYSVMGDGQKSIDYFERALAVHTRIKNPRGQGMVLTNLAWLYLSTGDAERGLDLARQAIPHHRAVGNRAGEADALGDIAWAYSQLGQHQKALESLDQALAIRRADKNPRGEAHTLSSIARTHDTLGNLSKARQYSLLALDAARRAGSPRVEVVELDRLGTIGNKLGQPGEALTHLNLALRLVRTMNDPAGESLVLSEMARSQFLLGNLEAARPLAADSVRLTESVRNSYLDPILRALYLSRSREAYSQLTRILMRLHARHPGQGFDREAFNTSERARSRSLLEILSGEQPDAVAPLDINRIQKDVLDADTILLQYVLSDESSFLFVVSRGRLTGYELPARRVIEDLARRVHQSWSAGSGSDNGSAAELTRIILQPAIEEIRGKRLLVSAEGALQYIPFAALPLPAGGRVVDSHEVVNLASASTIAVMRESTAARKPAAKWVAVIADPVFDPNDPRVTGKPGPVVLPRDLQRSVSDAGLTHLDRLLSTRREAQYIASLAPAGSLMQALDFDASRATATSARLSGYRIVHLAAHGLVNSRQPELSGIVLSMVDRQGRPQDGFLRAGEVHKLKLGADLVVLSACQTALGREIDGEGLIGLTRGFMRAGAPRVVASLWRVSDRATSELMKRFYQGMLSGKLSPAAALRQAQLDLSRQRQWAAPYYWAGFTLQGEWR